MILDRLKSGLAAFVQAVFPQIDYLAFYPAKVVKQNGTAFDVQPDSPRLPGMSGIPARLPFPGFSVQVQEGEARCLVGFVGGKPSAPFIALWEAPGVTEIGIDAPAVNLGDATAAVGRVGDTVDPDTTLTTWLNAVGGGGTPGPYPGGLTITSGSSKVKA